MKKAGIIVAAILIIALLVGSFYFYSRKQTKASVDNQGITEVEKLITKDIESNYPKTPREVVKLYNRIITAYYAQEFKEQELEKLTKQAWRLFDEDLQANNPVATYYASVAADIESYKAKEKLITQSDVCSSEDVTYKTDGDDKIAFVTTSYFIKEGKEYSRTYETFVLRKNAEGRWKILVYYQSAPASRDE